MQALPIRIPVMIFPAARSLRPPTQKRAISVCNRLADNLIYLPNHWSVTNLLNVITCVTSGRLLKN